MHFSNDFFSQSKRKELTEYSLCIVMNYPPTKHLKLDVSCDNQPSLSLLAIFS